MAKQLFRITIIDEEKKYVTLYASQINHSDFLGFVEISGLEFPEQSDIILTPGEDKARVLFKDTERIIMPGNLILRIEELKEDKKADVINLFKRDKNR